MAPARLPHIEDVLLTSLGQAGDRYVFGTEASPLDPNPDAFDCSELVEWSCARAGVSPRVPDGAYYQWRHTVTRGAKLSVPLGVRTRGALLFAGDGMGVGRDAIVHVAWSLGDGTTVEARGAAWGVGTWATADRFSFAGLLPGIDYRPRAAPAPLPPAPTPPPEDDDDMDSICVPSWGPDVSRGWTYKMTQRGTRPHVVALNGAPLNMGYQEGVGTVWNVSTVPQYGVDLAVAAVDLSPAMVLAQKGDRVVVVCEDGGWIDVARRP